MGSADGCGGPSMTRARCSISWCNAAGALGPRNRHCQVAGLRPKPNAFRKFGVYESYDLKLPRCLDRVGSQEPRPACDGLAHDPRTGAWPPRRDDAAADEGAPAANDTGL